MGRILMPHLIPYLQIDATQDLRVYSHMSHVRQSKFSAWSNADICTQHRIERPSNLCAISNIEAFYPFVANFSAVWQGMTARFYRFSYFVEPACAACASFSKSIAWLYALNMANSFEGKGLNSASIGILVQTSSMNA